MQFKPRRVQSTCYFRERRNECEDCDNGCLKIGKFAGSCHSNRTGKQTAEK